MSEITAVPLRPIAKGSLTRLWLGVAIAALAGAGLAYAGTEGVIGKPSAVFMIANADEAAIIKPHTVLQSQVLAQGAGASPPAADVALITYTGMLAVRTGRRRAQERLQ